MKNFFDNLLEIINKSETGHLPLKYRVDLMKSIGDYNIVNKVFFECVKYVSPLWNDHNSKDNLLNASLVTIYKFLYKNEGSLTDIEKLNDKLRNYFEDVSDDDYGMAGLSFIALCNSILSDAQGVVNIEDYIDEDDNAFDYDVWNPDFVASIAASGGNSFLNEGDVEKRKVFWRWFVETVSKLISNPNQQILPVKSDEIKDESNILTKRTQTYKVGDLIEEIKKVIPLAIRDLEAGNINDWETIELVGECLKGGLSMKGFYYDSSSQRNSFTVKYYLYKGDESMVNLMNKVKYSMYEQAPNEGAWFAYTLSIHKNSEFNLNLNYDNLSSLPENRQKPDLFSQEFEAFPRSKQFTPEWLENIVKKYKLKFI